MSKWHHPRRGSMQVWPRKRSQKPYARIHNWVKKEELKLLGFIGYKVGMSHAMVKDNTPNSITKNQIISIPITILECPPLKALSLRFYKQDFDGLKVVSEVFSKNIDKELKRKTKFSKKTTEMPNEFDDVRLVVYTKPSLTSVERKKPEVLEIASGGKTPKEKLEFLKLFLDKEIKISDVFKINQLIDVHAVTKGKGFQGTIKRFGVKRLSHKSKKKVRGIGTPGPWNPSKVRYTVPNTGKMGYHKRTEYNKLLLKISNNVKEVNPNSGFLKYGLIKNDYVFVKGSLPGVRKRPIILTEAVRPGKKTELFEITHVNLKVKE